MSLPYTKVEGTNSLIVLAGDEFMADWVRPSDLRNKYKGKSKVVLINGAFDLMHTGHMSMFKVAREVAGEKGKVLCALDSDRKIEESKGKGRPVLNFFHRVKAVSYMGADIVVEIDTELDFMDLIETSKPDVRVLGSEYKGVKSRIPHVPIVYVERPEGALSTTEIIMKCKLVD